MGNKPSSRRHPSRKDERTFWVPYCGYGPGWCVKTAVCPGSNAMLANPFDRPVPGCHFLKKLHPWTRLGAVEFAVIVDYAYNHPLRVGKRVAG